MIPTEEQTPRFGTPIRPLAKGSTAETPPALRLRADLRVEYFAAFNAWIEASQALHLKMQTLMYAVDTAPWDTQHLADRLAATQAIWRASCLPWLAVDRQVAYLVR